MGTSAPSQPCSSIKVQPTWWDDRLAVGCWERRALDSCTLSHRAVLRQDPHGLAWPIVVDRHPVWVGSTHTSVGLSIVPADGLCVSAEGLRVNESHLAWRASYHTEELSLSHEGREDRNKLWDWLHYATLQRAHSGLWLQCPVLRGRGVITFCRFSATWVFISEIQPPLPPNWVQLLQKCLLKKKTSPIFIEQWRVIISQGYRLREERRAQRAERLRLSE